MHGSNRGEGIAALEAKQTGARNPDQKAAAGDEQGGQPKQAISLPVEQLAANSEPTVTSQQAQTEQPDPYALRDLAAQEDMAFWAMWMLFAALATFAVTSFGTLLIWTQVRLTREAVEDTGKATEAMLEANRIAANQHRPIMLVSKVEGEYRLWNESIGFSWTVEFSNKGQSPCFVLGNYVQVYSRDDPERVLGQSRSDGSRQLVLPDETGAVVKNEGGVGGGHLWNLAPHRKVLNELFLRCAIVYIDLNGIIRRTNSTFLYARRESDTFEMLPTNLFGGWGDDIIKEWNPPPNQGPIFNMQRWPETEPEDYYAKR